MDKYSRPGKIKIFNFLQDSLTALEKEKSFSQSMNRLALAHRLSFHLENLSNIRADLCPALYKSKKMVNPDIFLHDGENPLLSIVCRENYLTEKLQEKLIILREKMNCPLVLGISFLSYKPYILIYCFEEDEITYYHFSRMDNSITLLKTLEIDKHIENQDQPGLGIRKKYK